MSDNRYHEQGLEVDYDHGPEHIFLHKYQHEDEPKFTDHAKVQVTDRFCTVSMNIQLPHDHPEFAHENFPGLLSVTDELLILFLRIYQVNDDWKYYNGRKE